MVPSSLPTSLQAATDTVFVASQPTTLDVTTDISVIVMAVVATLVLIGVAVLLRQMKRVIDRIHDEIKPAAERTRVAAQNVEYISGKVRDDMEKVHDVVDGITERLNTASDHMEERVQEFNALMEVVQGEAERVFIDTASVVRGMRAGAAHVGRRGAPLAVDPYDLDPDEREMLQEEAESTSPEAEPDPR